MRRLQLLRLLTQGAERSVADLTNRVKMSETAVSRHMDKLMRRGYVTCTKTKRMAAYSLGQTVTSSLHEDFLGLVQAEWRRR